MPVSGSYQIPCGLSTLADVTRHEKRINAYRKYHEASLSQNHASLVALNEECHQQTEKLREKLVPSRVKRKRSEARNKDSSAAASSSSGSSNPTASCSSTIQNNASSAFVHPPIEEEKSSRRSPGGEEKPMKQPKVEKDSGSLVSSALSISSASSCDPSVSLASVSQPAAATGSSKTAVKHEAALTVPSNGGTFLSSMDDLFGELTADIDYDHVLQQLSSETNDGGISSGPAEIPDIDDLSRIIEGAENGADSSVVGVSSQCSEVAPSLLTTANVTAPTGPASSILRNMAERLSSGSVGTMLMNPPSASSSSSSSLMTVCSGGQPSSSLPPATSTAPSASVSADVCRLEESVFTAPTASAQSLVCSSPSTSPASLPAASLDTTGAFPTVNPVAPKLTMQQRLKLKRQMMAEEFRQSHFRLQQQQQHISVDAQQQQQQIGISGNISPNSLTYQRQQFQLYQQQQQRMLLHRQQMSAVVSHVTAASTTTVLYSGVPAPSMTARYPAMSGDLTESCVRMMVRPGLASPQTRYSQHHHSDQQHCHQMMFMQSGNSVPRHHMIHQHNHMALQQQQPIYRPQINSTVGGSVVGGGDVSVGNDNNFELAQQQLNCQSVLTGIAHTPSIYRQQRQQHSNVDHRFH